MWLGPVYFRGSDGLMLVFNVNDKASFANVRSWMKLTAESEKDSERSQKILIGNKSDSDATERIISCVLLLYAACDGLYTPNCAMASAT
jgi:Ras-related protein Rab-21